MSPVSPRADACGAAGSVVPPVIHPSPLPKFFALSAWRASALASSRFATTGRSARGNGTSGQLDSWLAGWLAGWSVGWLCSKPVPAEFQA
eukprot:351505-Chlamydomonas_euryale.AAC.17